MDRPPPPAPGTDDDAGATTLLRQIAAGWVSQALHATVELGLPELLGEHSRTTAELAAHSACDRQALEQLLRALVAAGICHEEAPQRYALTAVGAHLRPDHPRSLAHWTRWWGRNLWPLWPELGASVRSGESARARLLGTQGFEHLQHDDESARLFHTALAELARLVADRVADLDCFVTARHLVDVGGGHGEILAAVLGRHRQLRATLLDQAHALPLAQARLDGAGVLDRSDLVAGDFFESVPAGADIYLLKSVLHDWADEPSIQILRNCRQALTRADARLLVVERVLPDRMQATAEHQDLARSDLTMLLAHGAGERRLADFTGLFAAAGLRLQTVRPLGLTMSVLELRAD